MSADRSTAQQGSDKSPSRAEQEMRRQHKLIRRTQSSRGTSAPARFSGSLDIEQRRSPSPLRTLTSRTDCSGHTSHESRLPRAHQRRKLDRRCHSETCLRRHTRASPLREMASPTKDLDEVLRQLYRTIVSLDKQDGQRKADNFLNASLDPPITRQSLSELDIGSIIINSKLRHDVNFDRELHFRPNLDGTKGRAKKKAQADYWSALVIELDLYPVVFNKPMVIANRTVSNDIVRRACMRRIPRMFRALKDILKALVPESDHQNIDQHLNIDMIMQEIEAGVCDLPRIARWMEHNLKAHCAPMRDNIIDKMVKYIDRGVSEGKSRYLVEGLIQMFAAMEAMKLDVANHQIRQWRMLLIEDTVNFEQRYHFDRIFRGRIDADCARLWYQKAAFNPKEQPKSNSDSDLNVDSHLTSFLNALLDTLLSPGCQPFPDTFKLDAERLKSIRSDIYDLFCINACETIFLRLAGRHQPSFTQRESFRSVVSIIVNQSPYGSSWEENIDNLVAEIGRHVATVIEESDSTVTAEQESCLRLEAEEMLGRVFSDPSRAFFVAQVGTAKQRLLPHIQRNLQTHLKAPLVDVFNTFLFSAAGSTQQTPGLPRPHNVDSVMSDVVRRISHLAILHWRTWAPIVYLTRPEPTTLPTRQHTVTSMSRSSSRGSPAPPQFLPSNSPDMECDDSDIAQSPSDSDAASTDVAVHQPRTVANLDAQPSADDSSSSALYRQQTN